MEKAFKNWTDRELVKYIVNNFKKITKIDIVSIFDISSNEDIFIQDKIFETYHSINDFLRVKAGKTSAEVDSIMYKLDDELMLYYDNNMFYIKE